MHDLKLKLLPARDLDAALQKANRYRDLNQPEEAESICKDILAVDPQHQAALRVLGLALTDRFAEPAVGLFEQAMEAFLHLKDKYDRTYHEGVAWERLGKAHLARGEGHGALTALEHALDLFEEAEGMAPEGNSEAVLRFNRCVRLLESHQLLSDAYDAPHSRAPHLGD
jgi:tetratricopeptide (TPR) repeat protein